MSTPNPEAREELLTGLATSVPRRKPVSLRHTAEKAIQERLKAVLKNEAGTRSGEDIEALHDMRVASRRLREALRIYSELFPQKKLKQAVRDTRRITTALGLVREVDVNLEQLRSWREKLGASYSFSMEFATVMELLSQRRLRKRMLARLNKINLEELHHDIFKMLERPQEKALENDRGTVDPCAQSPASFAKQHIEGGLKSILAIRDRIAVHPTLHNYHQLRIHTKKFRYTVELLSQAFKPGRGRRIVKHLKRLQDDLGELHDGDVLHHRVHDLRAELRLDQLNNLERELLRLMRVISREQTRRKVLIEKHLHRLDQRRFFERTLEGLKQQSPSAE
jgi:CHAD domain-containing protein